MVNFVVSSPSRFARIFILMKNIAFRSSPLLEAAERCKQCLNQTLMEREYPTILERIKSTTIDTIIIIAFMYLASEVLSSFENVPDYVRMILFAGILLYEPICTVFGATIGNDKMEIRVRSSSDHSKKINFFQAIIRFILKFSLGWLSFITFFFSKKSRTIHDYFSGSVMIRA